MAIHDIDVFVVFAEDCASDIPSKAYSSQTAIAVASTMLNFLLLL